MIELNHESFKPSQHITINGHKYKIEGRILQPMGRYSEVYPAVDVATGRLVAVKMMIPEGSLLGPFYNHNRNEREKAFENEINILSVLKNYRSIVRLQDHGIVYELGLPVLIEELIPRENYLLDRRSEMKREEGYAFCLELMSMLTVTHRLGIIYRDFQRAHIFWHWDENKRRGKLKVIDWNLSLESKPSDETLFKKETGYFLNSNFDFFLDRDLRDVLRRLLIKSNSATEVRNALILYGVERRYISREVGFWKRIFGR
jgi:serine/threonine protein kinase